MLDNTTPNMPSAEPRVDFTAPIAEPIPDVIFGDARTALGPHGDTVPTPAESLYPSGSPGGAAPRPDVGNHIGQGVQQGDMDFYQSQISENPSLDFYRNINDSFGTFQNKP
jgi:hypothetical protein